LFLSFYFKRKYLEEAKRMKNRRKNEAVSDIIGTVLLLGMAISLFAVLCIGVLYYPFTPAEPAVNIVGTLDEEYLFLEHCGGEPLSLDTKVILTIGENMPVSIIIGDGDYLTEEAKEDNKWNIGEGFFYSLDSYVGHQIKITVVDVESNSVIMIGSLKRPGD
jgi:hypothetical protein